MDAQIRQIGAMRGRELAGAPPSYLLAELGPPSGIGDDTWHQATGEIESYRARGGIEDQGEALPAPTVPAETHLHAVREQLVDLGYLVGIDGMGLPKGPPS